MDMELVQLKLQDRQSVLATQATREHLATKIQTIVAALHATATGLAKTGCSITPAIVMMVGSAAMNKTKIAV